MSFQEAWSCPDCSRTYRCPPGWEVYIWSATRRAAQVWHMQRHGRAALIGKRRRVDDPEIDYGGGLSKPT